MIAKRHVSNVYAMDCSQRFGLKWLSQHRFSSYLHMHTFCLVVRRKDGPQIHQKYYHWVTFHTLFQKHRINIEMNSRHREGIRVGAKSAHKIVTDEEFIKWFTIQFPITLVDFPHELNQRMMHFTNRKRKKENETTENEINKTHTA